MNILSLPADCHQVIYENLTINQVVRLRVVSKDWKQLIETICFDKKILHVFDSSTSVQNYFSSLSFFNCSSLSLGVSLQNSIILCLPKEDKKLKKQPKHSDDGASFLGRLFPNVTNFAICYDFENKMLQFDLAILRSWATTLTSFHLQVSSSTVHEEIAILNHLNCLVNLRKLQFYSSDFHMFSDTLKPLPKLEELSVYSKNITCHRVLRLAVPKITKLIQISGDLKLNSNQRLFNNVTQLSLLDSLKRCSQLPSSWTAFEAIEYLNIERPKAFDTFLQLYEVIKSMPTLKTLRLRLNCISDPQHRRPDHNQLQSCSIEEVQFSIQLNDDIIGLEYLKHFATVFTSAKKFKICQMIALNEEQVEAQFENVFGKQKVEVLRSVVSQNAVKVMFTNACRKI